MALDEIATAPTQDESVTAGAVTEESTLLLDGTNTAVDDSGNSGTTITTGDRVRQRLAVCLFLHIVGVAIVTQVYPRVRIGVRVAAEVVGWVSFGSRYVVRAFTATLSATEDVMFTAAPAAVTVATIPVDTCPPSPVFKSARSHGLRFTRVHACQFAVTLHGSSMPAPNAGHARSPPARMYVYVRAVFRRALTTLTKALT